MRILLTIDDCFNAPGLRLEDIAKETVADDIWIAAPERSNPAGAAPSRMTAARCATRKGSAPKTAWGLFGGTLAKMRAAYGPCEES